MKKFFIGLLVILFASPTFGGDWIIFLMDTSGSMSDRMSVKTADGSVETMRRIDAAKQAMIATVDKIPEGTNVGLLTFDGWKYEPGPVDKTKLKAAINAMHPEGGTPLGKYMKSAADQLLLARKRGDRGGNYTLVVVTDGLDNSGYVEQYTPDIVGRGLMVRAIGLDLAEGHVLSTMANEYINVNDPAALRKQLQNIVAEANFKDKAATDEMFDELKGLPTEVAFAVLQELTEQKNHPIGEEPVVEVRDEQGNIQSVPNEVGVVHPNLVKDEGMGGGTIFLIVVGVIFVGIVLLVFIAKLAGG